MVQFLLHLKGWLSSFSECFIFSCIRMFFSTLNVCAKLGNLVVGPALTNMKYSIAVYGIKTNVSSRFEFCLIISLCFTWFQSVRISVTCFLLNKTSCPTLQLKCQLPLYINLITNHVASFSVCQWWGLCTSASQFTHRQESMQLCCFLVSRWRLVTFYKNGERELANQDGSAAEQRKAMMLKVKFEWKAGRRNSSPWGCWHRLHSRGSRNVGSSWVKGT